MPPKKVNRNEGGLTPAQQRKADAAKAKAEEAETREQERLAEIQADPLVVRHSEATPALPVSHIFSKVITRKDFKLRKPESGRCDYDWSELRKRLAARKADSPTWFLHVRHEDLILEPDGLDGETVEVAVIVEATEPTLAPMHMVVREARPYSDLEDNTPERVVKLADQGFVWREVRADDGGVINVFLLQERNSPAAAAAAGGKSFSFGAAAPAASAAAPAPAPVAPTASVGGFGSSAPSGSVGFGGTPSASVQGAAAAAAALSAAAAASGGAPTGFGSAPAKTASFGFGSAAPAAAPAAAAPVKAASFGFGAGAPSSSTAAAAPTASTFGGRPVSPKPAQVPQVGFGAAAAPAPTAAAPAAGFATGFGNKSASGAINKSATDKVALENVQFTLWTEHRLKDMKKEIAAGSRIVIEGFQLPAPVNRKAKLQMQNDLKDEVADAVEFVIRKEFARLSGDMKKVDSWIDDCPVYDPKFADAIQKFRERQLDEAIEEGGGGGPSYEAVADALRPVLTAELEARVAERKAMLAKESDAIDDIITLVKKRKVLACKDAYRILKVYPTNDRLKFRPFGKVGGVHEAGEAADVCVPAPYVAKNNFAVKVAAMHSA